MRYLVSGSDGSGCRWPARTAWPVYSRPSRSTFYRAGPLEAHTASHGPIRLWGNPLWSVLRLWVSSVVA